MINIKIGIIFLITCLGVLFVSCKTKQDLIAHQGPEIYQKKQQFKIDSLEGIIKKLKSKLPFESFEPGRAYARCAIQAQSETIPSTTKYNIYTGDDKFQEGIEALPIVTSPSYCNWAKATYTEVCPSAKDDAYDCQIWQYKETPEVIDTIYIVRDTVRIKAFEYKSINMRSVVKSSRLTDFKEVSCCHGGPTPGLNKEVQKALMKNGYELKGEELGRIGNVTKEALIDYQEKNNLKIGELDIETLKHLGVVPKSN